MVEFRERIRAPWWAWLLIWSWTAMLGIAYGYATVPLVGLAITLVFGGLATVALARNAPLVTVDASGIHAGRAFLESAYLGQAEALDREAARRLRGVDADSRAYVLLRGWIATAVRLEVSDERDPTPYWYVSTRHPNALAMALTQARDGAGSGVTRSSVEGSSSDASAAHDL